MCVPVLRLLDFKNIRLVSCLPDIGRSSIRFCPPLNRFKSEESSAVFLPGYRQVSMCVLHEAYSDYKTGLKPLDQFLVT
jgi:hypothetical protein